MLEGTWKLLQVKKWLDGNPSLGYSKLEDPEEL